MPLLVGITVGFVCLFGLGLTVGIVDVPTVTYAGGVLAAACGIIALSGDG